MANKIIKTCQFCGKQYQSSQYGQRALNQKYCGTSCKSKGKISLASELFEKRFDRTEGCWEWKGNVNSAGYGRIAFQNKRQLAHRVAFFLAFPDKGRQLKDQCVLHKCDNRRCVNPSHLFLGSRAQNNLDKMDKQRHPKGETSHLSKLTEAQVLEIRRMFVESKMSYSELGRRFNTSRKNVKYIVDRVTWVHI